MPLRQFIIYRSEACTTFCHQSSVHCLLPSGNAPGRIRTCYPRLRRPMLYPSELRAQYCYNHVTTSPDQVATTINTSECLKCESNHTEHFIDRQSLKRHETSPSTPPRSRPFPIIFSALITPSTPHRLNRGCLCKRARFIPRNHFLRHFRLQQFFNISQ